RIDLQLMDWHQAQQMVQDDRADAVISMSITEARKKIYDFSDVITHFEFSLFLREGTVGVDSLADLEGKKVAVFRGGYPHHLLRHHKSITLVPVLSHPEGFRLLESGAVTAFATDQWVGSYTIQRLDLRGFTLEREPFAVQESAIAVKKGNKALLAEINLALTGLQKAGKIDRIEDKWRRKKMVFTTEEKVQAFVQRMAGGAAVILCLLMAGWVWVLKRQIRQRKKAETELKIREEQYRNIFDHVVEGIYQSTPEGAYLSVNEAQARLYGYSSPQEMIASVTDIPGQLYVHPDERGRMTGLLEKNGQVSHFEFQAYRKDGSIIWVDNSVRAVRDASGKIRYYEGTNIDITERKQAEHRQLMINSILGLLSSEKNIRSLIRDIVLLIREYTGVEACGIRLNEGEDFPYFESTGFPDDFIQSEKYLCTRDSEGRIIRDTSGNPCLECMCGNVLLGRTNPVLPFFTPDGSFWTNSTTKLLASTSEEDRQARTRNRCNGEGYESVALIPVQGGDAIIGLLQLNDRRPDLFSLDFIRHLEGISVSIGGAIQRIRAEDALREAEERIRLSFENANIGMCLIGLEGELLKVNREMCHITGYTHEEMEGANLNDFIHPDDRDICMSVSQKALLGGQHHNELYNRYIHKSGQMVFCKIATSLIQNEQGHPLYFIAHVQDITERRKMEERLARAEKMEALGLLAGGVAHDLNNVIGVTIGHSELLIDEIAPDSPLRFYATSIMQSTEKAAAIIQDLLTMARRGVTVSAVINLNGVITDYMNSPELTKMLAGYPGADVQTRLEPRLLNIKGSPVHLGKAFLNLLTNALEALNDDGKITVETHNCHLDHPVNDYDQFKDGDYVVLTVRDNGKGICAEDLGRIFEPFYTKKVMGRSGTGLGLAIVWGTVKDHQGFINVESQPQQGTTFSLYFPVAREDLTKATKTVERKAYMGRGESLLVVDDIPEQRQLAVSFLEKLNYLVTAVASGEEAVEFVKKTNVDLLVLDMIMDPGIDGLETYRRIIEINPKQKAIIVSGFAETNRVAETLRLGAGAYVRKPYTMENVGLAVRKELDKTTS
ncbi:MAG: PAS domain S-box protein, partial [Smithellaceae bacterium]